MKNGKILSLLIIGLVFILSCKNQEDKQKYYLFETYEYIDYDDECEVIYLKSHKQLIEEMIFDSCNTDIYDGKIVYNALGHNTIPESIFWNKGNYTIYTRKYTIKVDSTESYDISIHIHPGIDSILTISSPFELQDIELTRYYMPEVYKIDSIRSVFQFLYPLPMLWDYNIDTCGKLYTYTLDLMNYDSIDFEHGERVVLEYDTYKIPIPYQIFIKQ